jgi:hypothetical protein
MLTRLFPRQIDNDYRGRVIAIWLLVPLALVKLLQGASVAGLNPLTTSRRILETADRVPAAPSRPKPRPISSSSSQRGDSGSSSWASSRSSCSSAIGR